MLFETPYILSIHSYLSNLYPRSTRAESLFIELEKLSGQLCRGLAQFQRAKSQILNSLLARHGNT